MQTKHLELEFHSTLRLIAEPVTPNSAKYDSTLLTLK